MIYEEVYKMILSKGAEYIQNPEHRSQIMKVTFVVIMKLFSMIRKRIRGKKMDSEEHIECNCNSCKVWRAKLDDAFQKSHSSSSSQSSSSNSTLKSKIWSFLKFNKNM